MLGQADPYRSDVEPPWRLGFRSLEREHVEPIDLPLDGELPEEVEGTLYRNGPARHVVYGEPLHHWFDGDGMIHAFRIERGRVRYQNRFVRTPGHLREDAEQRRIFGCFMTGPAGNPIERFLRRHQRKNGANTSVVKHAGTLFALWEGSWPVRLDPATLDYLGEDGLDEALLPDDTFSAHPRFDEATGELWNFSQRFGRVPTTRVLARDSTGRTRHVADVRMPMPAMQHDFGLTARHVVLHFDPYVLPAFPLWLILNQKSFGQCLSWKPELGMKLVVVPRDGGPQRVASAPSRLAEHVIHAFDDGDDVVMDVLSFPDATVMQTLQEVMVGPIRTPACSFPERIRIPPSGRVTIERIGDVPMELPRHLAPVGARHRHVFGTAWTDPSSFMSAPARLDVETHKTEVARMGPGEFAGECVPIAKRGATDDGAAWLLTVVLNATRERSELRVYDGEDLAAPPVAVAAAPHVIPFGFHGSFVPR